MLVKKKMMNPMINNIDFNFVELTAGNSKRALLSVERVELQVHRASKSERHPGEKQSKRHPGKKKSERHPGEKKSERHPGEKKSERHPRESKVKDTLEKK